MVHIFQERGYRYICSICLIPFKKARLLKSHLKSRHSTFFANQDEIDNYLVQCEIDNFQSALEKSEVSSCTIFSGIFYDPFSALSPQDTQRTMSLSPSEQSPENFLESIESPTCQCTLIEADFDIATNRQNLQQSIANCVSASFYTSC